MKFFGRQNEIKELREIRNLSLQTARFTIVTGRRRSGKTSLLIKAYEDVQDMLYFFVARKSEAELCRDFIEEMTSKLQLPILGEVTRFVVCGSVYSLMNIIFKNNKQPLYGRQTGEIKVTPFPPSVVKEILSTYNSAYTNDDLLALYSYTGGVAEYVEMMMDAGATTKEQRLCPLFRNIATYRIRLHNPW